MGDVSADEGGKIALDEALAAHGAGTSEKVAASLILGALDKICKCDFKRKILFFLDYLITLDMQIWNIQSVFLRKTRKNQIF